MEDFKEQNQYSENL